MKIDTVIFDIGGVLSVLGRMKFFRSFGYSEEVCREIMQATVLSRWWRELDRAVMPVPEIIDHFVAENPALEKEIRHIMEDIRGIVVPSEDAVRWIRKVKSTGRRVLYLSNWSQKVTDDCPGVLYFIAMTWSPKDVSLLMTRRLIWRCPAGLGCIRFVMYRRNRPKASWTPCWRNKTVLDRHGETGTGTVCA